MVVARHKMGGYFFIVVFLGLVTVIQCACNVRKGPPGSPECVKLSGYSGGPQWATCLSNTYIKTYSKGQHKCENSATFCYYQCMVELHSIRYGNVTDDCKCSSTMTTARPGATTLIPDTCYSPAGDDCSWYRDCLEKRYPCKQQGESYAIDYAEKFCELYEQHASRFDAQGEQWIDATRKCLQVSLVPILRPFVTMTCDEIKDKAFDSHPDCYTNPGNGAPSICDIGYKNWFSVLMTVKGAFVDAPIATLVQMLKVGMQCSTHWISNSEHSHVQVLNIHFHGRTMYGDRTVYRDVVQRLADNRKWADNGIQYMGYPIPVDEQSFAVNILVVPAEQYDFNYHGGIAANTTAAVYEAADAVENGNVWFNLPGREQATNFSICNDYKCDHPMLTVAVPRHEFTNAGMKKKSPHIVFVAFFVCVSAMFLKHTW